VTHFGGVQKGRPTYVLPCRLPHSPCSETTLISFGTMHRRSGEECHRTTWGRLMRNYNFLCTSYQRKNVSCFLVFLILRKCRPHSHHAALRTATATSIDTYCW
jgi:hypothetical protein